MSSEESVDIIEPDFGEVEPITHVDVIDEYTMNKYRQQYENRTLFSLNNIRKL